MTEAPKHGGVLIVIPTLNEARYIEGVVTSLLPFATDAGALIVVSDGGSDDGTPDIVRSIAAREASVRVIHNPARLQSSAINLAVETFAGDAKWLIRIDAHSGYPPHFCETLLAEAEETGADVVAISVHAKGLGFWQHIIAVAQNSRFGNGGAPHRVAPVGRWVDHAHHALMRLSAFKEVGGYDARFSHNEDAELDFRFRQAGYRIWLTARTVATYYPRPTLRALARQYFRFGRGRAENMMKHRMRPGLRQAIVIGLAPALALAVLGPLSTWFLLPLAVWVGGCAIAGVATAWQTRSLPALLSGLAAGVMHAAWSAGFWSRLLDGLEARRFETSAP